MSKDAFELYWSRKRKQNKWVYLSSISIAYGFILTLLLALVDREYSFSAEWSSIHPYLTMRFVIFSAGWFLFKIFQWNKMEKTYRNIQKEKNSED